MSILIRPNDQGEGEELDLDITVEAGDGLYIALAAMNDDGDEVIGYIIERRNNIEEFFRMIERVRQDYLRQRV